MKLWSWGANTNGQLGHGFASEQISRPEHVTTESISHLLLDNEIQGTKNVAKPDATKTKETSVKIHGGGTQVLLCINKHRGEEVSSILLQLGNVTVGVNNNTSTTKRSNSVSTSNSTLPQFQPKLISEHLQVKSLSCGWDFNLLTTTNDQVYSWGENKYGQLGRECDSHESQLRLEPLYQFEACQISAGLRHAAAIGTDGHLYIWGDNSKSQLGLSTSEKIIRKPTKLYVEGNDVPTFVNVRCGKSFTIALDDKNQLWGCGSNKFGQLGLTQSSVTELTKLPLNVTASDAQVDIENVVVPIKEFKCGWNHVLVLLANGKLVSWGRNNFNQLGRKVRTKVQPCNQSDIEFDPHPGYVDYVPEVIDSIACGSEHNLILGLSGTVYSWGWNEHENCGVKSSRISTSEGGVKFGEDCVISPTVVRFPNGTGKILQVACGAGNGFALSDY